MLIWATRLLIRVRNTIARGPTSQRGVRMARGRLRRGRGLVGVCVTAPHSEVGRARQT
jgi:hypothetical protein